MELVIVDSPELAMKRGADARKPSAHLDSPQQVRMCGSPGYDMPTDREKLAGDNALAYLRVGRAGVAELGAGREAEIEVEQLVGCHACQGRRSAPTVIASWLPFGDEQLSRRPVLDK